MRLEDMVLKSGRVIGFGRSNGEYVCYLFSRNESLLEKGTGACRLDALRACARNVWERSYRQANLSHERYLQRVWFELQELVASCAVTIPQEQPKQEPSAADYWGRE